MKPTWKSIPSRNPPARTRKTRPRSRTRPRTPPSGRPSRPSGLNRRAPAFPRRGQTGAGFPSLSQLTEPPCLCKNADHSQTESKGGIPLRCAPNLDEAGFGSNRPRACDRKDELAGRQSSGYTPLPRRSLDLPLNKEFCPPSSGARQWLWHCGRGPPWQALRPSVDSLEFFRPKGSEGFGSCDGGPAQ